MDPPPTQFDVPMPKLPPTQTLEGLASKLYWLPVDRQFTTNCADNGNTFGVLTRGVALILILILIVLVFFVILKVKVLLVGLELFFMS